jgi:GTP diphosphokinase / guanosine-3',5'-bis(diphosphate) 3'-diphosphatase
VRTQQRNEYLNLGRAILAKTFKQEGEDLTEKMLEGVLAGFNKKTTDDLIAEVGEGLINRTQVFEAVFPERKITSQPTKKSSLLDRLRKKPTDTKQAMPIRGLIPGMALHFAGCCHPIPGDKIVGIVTTGKGITIHTTSCETLENYSDTPERWIDVAWDTGSQAPHVARIKASISHETGGLAAVTSVIAKDLGNITNLKILNRSTDFFELLLDIEVRDTRHLNTIIASLRGKQVVQSVERSYG